MKRFQGFLILFLILGLPLVAYFFLKTGTHRVKPLKIISPLIANPGGSPDSVYHSLGDFSFVSQTGDTITQDSLADKIWVVQTFFTNCKMNCPKLDVAFKSVQEYYGSDPDVKLVSLSIDPERDNVKALRSHADKVDAIDHKWYLLTGNKVQLHAFAKKECYFEFKEDEDPEVRYEADKTVRLVDKDGRLRGLQWYDGTNKQQTDSLVAHIQLLKREYAQDK